MRYILISIMTIALMNISFSVKAQSNSGKTKISSTAYKAKTAELFKELMVLKKDGVFPSRFGLSDANPKAHDWYLKWDKFSTNSECQIENHVFDCALRSPDDVLWLVDLYRLATYLWHGEEKGGENIYQKSLLDRFKLAVTCYETPDIDICKGEQEIEDDDAIEEELKRLGL